MTKLYKLAITLDLMVIATTLEEAKDVALDNAVYAIPFGTQPNGDELTVMQ